MNSVTFNSLLLLLFIGLKLAGILSWSWVWVLAPFWIPATIGLLALAALLAYYKWFETPAQKEARQLRAALAQLSRRL